MRERAYQLRADEPKPIHTAHGVITLSVRTLDLGDGKGERNETISIDLVENETARREFIKQLRKALTEAEAAAAFEAVGG